MPVKNALLTAEKGIRFIENALVYLCNAIFMAMMFLGTADVIGRGIFNKPITGTYELSEVMMGAIVLLGWAYTQRMGEHVSVDLVYNIFPKKMKDITNTIVTFLVLVLFVFITIHSWDSAYNNMLEGRHFIILDFPSWPFYFLVPVGGFFICLELMVQLAYFIAGLGKK